MAKKRFAPSFRIVFDAETNTFRARWFWPNGAQRVVWTGEQYPSKAEIAEMSARPPKG
jgi:hypothetical protein